MLKGFFNVPKAVNEPVKSYAPGSPERAKVAETYKTMWNSQVEVPLYIGSEEIKTCIITLAEYICVPAGFQTTKFPINAAL